MGLELRGAKLLARKYEKPEKIGSIYVNPAWKTDNSRSLWEVEESSPGADSLLGVSLEQDWILVTPPNSGVFLRHDSEGREIFILAASSVLRIIPWTSEALPLRESKVLVELEKVDERMGEIVVLREDAAPTSGFVTEVGEDVKEISVGDRVFFTRYSGTKTEIHGVQQLILDEASILAVIPAGVSAVEHT